MRKFGSMLMVLLLFGTTLLGNLQSEASALDDGDGEQGGLMDSAWPMKCHDTKHTGRSPYSTVDNTGVEKWRFLTTGWVDDGPTIDSNGVIYFKGAYNYLDRYLFAVYPNGTLKWRFKTNGLIWGSSPAIAEDGTIYVGSWDDYFYAIYPNGTLKWRFCTYDDIASSPVIGEDGTIYVGTMGNTLYALNPDGTEKWHYTTGNSITSDPAIGPDGTIYFGSLDDHLYALYPNGTLKWRFKTKDYVKGPPSIAEDGTIYIGSYDDYLYALYPNGTMKWKCKIGYGTDSNPSIGIDGTIYVGGKKLYAVNPDGTLKWSFDLGPERWIGLSSPAISADGTIYVGTIIGDGAGGEIIAVNPDGSEKWRKRVANKGVQSSPAIAKDGTVYIGSAYEMGKGYLHAFGKIESNSPPQEPIVTGELYGKAETPLTFTFKAYDPDNNPIRFYIDWGDGTPSDWSCEYASNENVRIEHTWSKEGTYTIRVKSRDVLGEESSWTNTTIRIFPKQMIAKPQPGLYVMNYRVRRYLDEDRMPIILGPIDVEVDVSSLDFEVTSVEFYIDNVLKQTLTSEPFIWKWSDIVFFTHTIKIVVCDDLGNTVGYSIKVWKFF